MSALPILTGCNGSFSFDPASVGDGGGSFDANAPVDATIADSSAPADTSASDASDASGDTGSTDATIADTGLDASDSGSADSGMDAQNADSGPLSDPGTNCGDAGSCAPASELCCSTSSGFSCIASGQAVCAGVRILCDDSVGCPASAPFCCMDMDDGKLSAVECKQTCSTTIFCDPYNTKCPSGTSCLAFSDPNLPAGYMSCQ